MASLRTWREIDIDLLRQEHAFWAGPSGEPGCAAETQKAINAAERGVKGAILIAFGTTYAGDLEEIVAAIDPKAFVTCIDGDDLIVPSSRKAMEALQEWCAANVTWDE